MPIEKSAGAVIFRKQNDAILYLLLHYEAGHWDLAKGHIEKGENEIATIKREVDEETGLKDIKFIRGFREVIKYYFRVEGKTILKFVVFYLAETERKEIKISEEHKSFAWLPYQEAIKQLTFKNAKQILQKANDYLTRT